MFVFTVNIFQSRCYKRNESQNEFIKNDLKIILLPEMKFCSYGMIVSCHSNDVWCVNLKYNLVVLNVHFM